VIKSKSGKIGDSPKWITPFFGLRIGSMNDLEPSLSLYHEKKKPSA
jgi:hypothetical protein